MIVRNMETEMQADQHFTRLDTLEIKSHIERKLGSAKSQNYFRLLTRYLSLKISKSEFDRLCVGTIGGENVRLHNHLLRSIIKNAGLSKTAPPKESKVDGSLSGKVSNGYQRSCLQSLCKDIPQSSRKGMTLGLRDCKFKDRRSPLGPHGKSNSIACEDYVPKIQQQQTATDLLSLGSRPPGSVETGEEVDQAAASPSIYSRSPIKAPLGIPLKYKWKPKVLPCSSAGSYYTEICQNRGELPDTNSLRTLLGCKLEMEGLKVSVDCANLLNNGLNVFMKRLIKPCLELAGSRSGHKHIDPIHGSFSASMLDFQVAMELNPQILGNDWPSQLEIIACMHQRIGD